MDLVSELVSEHQVEIVVSLVALLISIVLYFVLSKLPWFFTDMSITKAEGTPSSSALDQKRKKKDKEKKEETQQVPGKKSSAVKANGHPATAQAPVSTEQQQASSKSKKKKNPQATPPTEGASLAVTTKASSASQSQEKAQPTASPLEGAKQPEKAQKQGHPSQGAAAVQDSQRTPTTTSVSSAPQAVAEKAEKPAGKSELAGQKGEINQHTDATPERKVNGPAVDVQVTTGSGTRLTKHEEPGARSGTDEKKGDREHKGKRKEVETVVAPQVHSALDAEPQRKEKEKVEKPTHEHSSETAVSSQPAQKGSSHAHAPTAHTQVPSDSEREMSTRVRKLEEELAASRSELAAQAKRASEASALVEAEKARTLAELQQKAAGEHQQLVSKIAALESEITNRDQILAQMQQQITSTGDFNSKSRDVRKKEEKGVRKGPRENVDHYENDITLFEMNITRPSGPASNGEPQPLPPRHVVQVQVQQPLSEGVSGGQKAINQNGKNISAPVPPGTQGQGASGDAAAKEQLRKAEEELAIFKAGYSALVQKSNESTQLLEKEKARSMDESQKAAEQNRALGVRIQQLETELGNGKQLLAQIQQAGSTSNAEKVMMQQQLAQLQSQLNASQEHVKNAHAELADRETELSKRKIELEQIRNQLSNSLSAIHEFGAMQQSLQQAQRLLEHEKLESDKRVGELQSYMATREARIRELEQHIQETDRALAASSVSAAANVEELRRLKELEDKLKEFDSRTNELQALVANKDGRISELEQQLTSQTNSTSSESQKSAAELQGLKTRAEELENQLATKSNQIAKLESQLHESETQVANLSSATSSAATEQLQIREKLEQQNEELRKRSEEMSSHFEEEKSRVAKLEAQLAESDRRCTAQAEDLASKSELVHQIEESKKNLAELQSQTSQKDTQIAQLESKLHEAEKEVQTLSSASSTAQTEAAKRQELETEIANIKQQREADSAKLTSIETDLNASRQSCVSLQATLDSESLKANGLASEKLNLQKELAMLRAQLEAQALVEAELRSAVNSSAADASTAQVNEQLTTNSEPKTALETSSDLNSFILVQPDTAPAQALVEEKPPVEQQ